MKKLSKIILFMMLLMIGVAALKSQGQMEIQERLAKELIRFHVRANSDTDADQAIKLLVKDRVVEYMEPLLQESASIEESRRILMEHSEDIRQKALQVIEENHCDYDVSVYFEESYFPMKTYGDITLPPGKYEAFRVDIGGGQGKNWWCVLYPPLCFVDATHGSLPEASKAQLKNVLEPEEYNAITKQEVKFRFKYLTFLNGLLE